MRPVLLAIAVLFGACTTAEETPADLLPRDTFTRVLLEAQLIEAKADHERVIDKVEDVPYKEYYDRMFAEQGVTEHAFTVTYRWYVDHPAELKDIYSDVLTGLQKRADVSDSTGTVH